VGTRDRWHLIDNLADALERFLLPKRAVLQESAAVAVAARQAAQRPVDEMYQGKRQHPPAQAWMARGEEESERRLAPRRAAYEAVVSLQGKGADIPDIARTVGVSRTTVYRYLREGAPQRKCPARHGRQRVLEPWEPYLLQRWGEDCHTATRLWREIREQGFAHSVTNVQRFVAQIRREGPAPIPKAGSSFASARGPSPRRVTSLLLQRAEGRPAEGAAYLDRLCQADAAIKTAAALAQDFLTMVRERHGERLDDWMEQAERSEVADLRRFAAGLRGDVAAVRAGITVEHNNGQTEGQINRLKLIRRTMYGRGNVDLLRQRVLRAG
jgi:transposase